MQFLTDGVSLEQAVARITQIMGDWLSAETAALGHCGFGGLGFPC
jgi:hypothetical protein